MCLPAQAFSSAKLGQIREIKVSMESEEHVRPLWAHNLTQACKLACMHEQAYISAKFGQIREIKVSIGSRENARTSWAYNLTQAHKLACMHGMCFHARPIPQPSWVGPEISKYLLNQENMPDFSEHIIWPEHASLCACTLCASVPGPISQPNWVGYQR